MNSYRKEEEFLDDESSYKRIKSNKDFRFGKEWKELERERGLILIRDPNYIFKLKKKRSERNIIWLWILPFVSFCPRRALGRGFQVWKNDIWTFEWQGTKRKPFSAFCEPSSDDEEGGGVTSIEHLTINKAGIVCRAEKIVSSFGYGIVSKQKWHPHSQNNMFPELSGRSLPMSTLNNLDQKASLKPQENSTNNLHNVKIFLPQNTFLNNCITSGRCRLHFLRFIFTHLTRVKSGLIMQGNFFESLFSLFNKVWPTIYSKLCKISWQLSLLRQNNTLDLPFFIDNNSHRKKLCFGSCTEWRLLNQNAFKYFYSKRDVHFLWWSTQSSA